MQTVLSKLSALTRQLVATERSRRIEHIIAINPTRVNISQQLTLHVQTIAAVNPACANHRSS